MDACRTVLLGDAPNSFLETKGAATMPAVASAVRRTNWRRVKLFFIADSLLLFGGNFADVNVFEPKRVTMVLQLNLALGKYWLRSVPVILQRRIVYNEFVVQEYVNFFANHHDAKTVPLANRLIGNFDRFARILLVVVKGARAD